MTNNIIDAVLGNIGCTFRSNIENHIKDYKLQKGDDVEWLLDTLDELSYPKDYVLGHSIKFGEFERETLVKYDCGIMY